MRRRLPVALLLAAAALAPAQEAPAERAAPRRVLLYMAALPRSEIGDDELLLLYEGFLARLIAAAPAVAPVEAPAVGRAPASPNERSREAWHLGAEAWLWVGVESGGAALRLQSLDVAAGGEIQEASFDAPDAWEAAAAAVQRLFASRAPARPAAAGPAAAVEVRIRAAAGSRISGLEGGDLVIGEGGQAVVSLPSRAAYTLVATHPGYLPEARTFYLDEAPLMLDIGQRPVSRWAFELSLIRLSYPSFEAQWLAMPERLFVGLGVVSFAAGIPLWGKEDDTVLPLTQVGISAGLYLGGAQRALRPYVSVEAFARLLGQDGGGWPGVEMDPMSRAGIGAALGVEVAKHPVVRLFAEANPQAYLLADRDEVELYYETLELFGRDVPWYVYAGPFLVDLLSFEVGARIRL